MNELPANSAGSRTALEVARALRNGDDELLVCAYDSPLSLRKFPLEGALELARLRELEPTLERDTRIVFYCWCPSDKTSRERAAEYRARGFERAGHLEGGVAAWLAAGLKLARPGADESSR